MTAETDREDEGAGGETEARMTEPIEAYGRGSLWLEEWRRSGGFSGRLEGRGEIKAGRRTGRCSRSDWVQSDWVALGAGLTWVQAWVSAAGAVDF